MAISKHFIGEAIEPIAEAMDTRRMATGEPGLPMRSAGAAKNTRSRKSSINGARPAPARPEATSDTSASTGIASAPPPGPK
ncbi:MAG: hypothetical protein FJ291_14995 [Planctomycetes bacterium]|nr:hypothetical protein [Planctomycetota bacterium]